LNKSSARKRGHGDERRTSRLISLPMYQWHNKGEVNPYKIGFEKPHVGMLLTMVHADEMFDW
jgi:hypothetical protein